MSVKNKAKDRDRSGRIRRKYTGPESTWCGTPSWWINMFMNRPKRAENKRLCRKVMLGADPEKLTFPLGNRKPHMWYW